jgi:hypothetical protein
MAHGKSQTEHDVTSEANKSLAPSCLGDQILDGGN